MNTGYVNIESTISEACSRLGISNEETYRARFYKLIIDAQIKIGTGAAVGIKYNVYQSGNEFFPDGQRLLMPHEMIDFHCFYDKDFDKIDPCDYVIRGKYVYFKKPFTTDPLILMYNGLLFDLEENPVISYNHNEAITSYLIYMEMTTRYYSKKAPRYMYIDSQNEWSDRLAEARGNDMFPTWEILQTTSAILYSTKLFLKYGTCVCEQSDPLEALKTYYSLKELKYGILPLGEEIVTAEDYTGNNFTEIETSVGELESGDFVLAVTDPGKFTLIVPFATGEITSMKDALGNEILNGYFNKIDDLARQIFIYVANEFLTEGNYNLTFEFNDQ